MVLLLTCLLVEAPAGEGEEDRDMLEGRDGVQKACCQDRSFSQILHNELRSVRWQEKRWGTVWESPLSHAGLGWSWVRAFAAR